MNRENSPTNTNASNRGTAGDSLINVEKTQVTYRPPVAAVIRPTTKIPGTDQTIRIDAAEPQTRAPHMRTHQLEDYVSWLREQAKRDKAAKIAAANAAPESRTTPLVTIKQSNSSSVPSPPIRTSSISAKSSDSKTTTSKSTPHSTTSRSQKTRPQISFAIEKSQRADPAHAVEGAHHAAPAPNVSAADFKFDADLERILKKLNMPEVLRPQKPTAINPQTATAKSNFEQSANHNEIVQTVSQAIASVLNDKPESSHATSNVRQIDRRMESTSARLDADHSKQKSALGRPSIPTDRTTPKSTPTASTKTESASRDTATKTALPLESKPKQHALPNAKPARLSNDKPNSTDDLEIPTNIAAWDVDDFRWPKVSNQMIAAGASAIEALTNSVFQSLTAGQKRIGITSPGRGEGTTAIAVSLARWAAAGGQRVLLVDADLASPGLSNQVGLGPNISWSNAISSSLDPAEVTIRSQKSPLCVMPLAPIETRVRWPRFIYDQLGDLVNQVTDAFDLVVFDLGPSSQLVAELSQSRLLIDAALIVHNGHSSTKFLQTKEQLLNFGINQLIVAQNGVRPARSNVA